MKRNIIKHVETQRHRSVFWTIIYNTFANKGRFLFHYNYAKMPKFLKKDLKSAAEITKNDS